MPSVIAKGLECLRSRATEWGVDLRILVIGGQAVLAYCGRIRVTKDLDLVSPEEDRGQLIALLKGCSFTVEESSFGLRAVRDSDGSLEVIHVSIGNILDESRGPGRTLVYEVSRETYSNARRIPLPGLVKAEEDEEIVEPVLPLPDLLLTKLIPVGRETDLEDVVTLIIQQADKLDEAEVVDRVAGRRELRKAILERLEALAQFVREHEVGRVWLGQTWTPSKRGEVLAFVRKLSNHVCRI